MSFVCSGSPTRPFLRKCTGSTGLYRSISSSQALCAKASKKKAEKKPMVKKSQRKGEAEPVKKARLSPEQEVKAIIKRSQFASMKNENKMTIEEAVRVLKAVEVRSPWSAYELLVKTAVMRGRAVPRGQLVLPRDPRTSKDIIAYFVEENRVQEALDAGVTYAGGADLIPKFLAGEIQPTKVFATPALLPVITPKLGRFLGPKGLMPSEKKGTASNDIAQLVQQSQGNFDWKGDKTGTIQAAIARVNFPVEDVVENIKAFMKSVHENSKDSDDALNQRKSKKMNSVSILSVRLSSRQGPGIELLHV